MTKVKTVVTGVGSRIKELIKEGKLTNKEILELVRQEHPLRKTTYACVAWYQSKLRKEAAEAPDTSAADAWAKAEGLEPADESEVDDAETLDDMVQE